MQSGKDETLAGEGAVLISPARGNLVLNIAGYLELELRPELECYPLAARLITSFTRDSKPDGHSNDVVWCAHCPCAASVAG